MAAFDRWMRARLEMPRANESSAVIDIDRKAFGDSALRDVASAGVSGVSVTPTIRHSRPSSAVAPIMVCRLIDPPRGNAPRPVARAGAYRRRAAYTTERQSA